MGLGEQCLSFDVPFLVTSFNYNLCLYTSTTLYLCRCLCSCLYSRFCSRLRSLVSLLMSFLYKNIKEVETGVKIEVVGLNLTTYGLRVGGGGKNRF